jgi:hypothetical protein
MIFIKITERTGLLWGELSRCHLGKNVKMGKKNGANVKEKE